MAASRRKVSRAPRPQGVTPRSNKSCQSCCPSSALSSSFGTVFAGVARASREHWLAEAVEVEHPVAEAGQAAEIFAAQFLQQAMASGPWRASSTPPFLMSRHRQAGWFHLFTNPGGVAVGTGGIDHQHQSTPFGIDGTAVVNDEVVANAAVLVQQNGVAGFARDRCGADRWG